MKSLVKKTLAKINQSESGFTLIELLVVVGIIVALAAVIVPAVAKFSTKGEEGGAAGEHDTVQVAMDATMAGALLETVNATSATGFSASGEVVNDLSAAGFGDLDPADAVPDVLISDNMRDNPTRYWYCWDAAGNVYQAEVDPNSDGIFDPASVADYDAESGGTNNLDNNDGARCGPPGAEEIIN